MRPYLAIFSSKFRTLLQYRTAAIAGFTTQIFWGLIKTFVFTAFYESCITPQPMTLTEVISYIWLGQALFAILPWFRDRELVEKIRSGAVAYELLKPIDTYILWLARQVAHRSAPTIMRAIPLFVIAVFFLGLKLPPSVLSSVFWLLSLVGAVVLSAAISTIFIILTMWTIAGEGFTQLNMVAALLFTGNIVPIPLFPDWAQEFLVLTPYAGIFDLPFRIYSGMIPPEECWSVFLHQFGWILVLVILGRALLKKGLHAIVIQGG